MPKFHNCVMTLIYNVIVLTQLRRIFICVLSRKCQTRLAETLRACYRSMEVLTLDILEILIDNDIFLSIPLTHSFTYLFNH